MSRSLDLRLDGRRGLRQRRASSRFLTLPNDNRAIPAGAVGSRRARQCLAVARARSSRSFRCWARCCASSTSIWWAADTGLRDEEPIHYFAVHAEEWRAAQSWPPVETATRQFFTAPADIASRMARRRRHGEDEYQVDFTIGTGAETRYERIAGIDSRDYYADWQSRDRKDAELHRGAARPRLQSSPAMPRRISVALVERARCRAVRLSVRGRGRRHRSATSPRACCAPSIAPRRRRRAELPHDLAVAQLYARRCRAAMPAGRAAAPALRAAADGVALFGRQPHPASRSPAPMPIISCRRRMAGRRC